MFVSAKHKQFCDFTERCVRFIWKWCLESVEDVFLISRTENAIIAQKHSFNHFNLLEKSREKWRCWPLIKGDNMLYCVYLYLRYDPLVFVFTFCFVLQQKRIFSIPQVHEPLTPKTTCQTFLSYNSVTGIQLAISRLFSQCIQLTVQSKNMTILHIWKATIR